MKKNLLFIVCLTLFAMAWGSAFSWAADPVVVNPKAKFPEGPVMIGHLLYYAEYGGHTVTTWDGKENKVFWKQDGCGPSAVVPYGKGFLVTCYDSGSIVEISAQGKTVRKWDKAPDGKPLLGPNDFTPDKKGGVYFSASGPWESDPIVGKIFHIDAKGNLKEVAANLHYANGLALTADGKILFCVESEAARIIQFKVAPDGSLSDRRLFIRIGQVDEKSGPYAYPDGIKLDSKGNLWIGHYSQGRILVVNPKKKLIASYDVPSPASPNLCFGPGEKVIYVMAVDDVKNPPYMGKVYKVKVK
jgi:gluconolactonase